MKFEVYLYSSGRQHRRACPALASGRWTIIPHQSI